MNSGIPVVADQIDSMSPDPPSCLPPSIQERLAHYNQKWWLLALVRVDPNTKGNEAQIPIKVVWGVHPLTIAEQVTRQLEIRDQAIAALESIWTECIPYLPGATICEGIRGKGAIQWLWKRLDRIQTERGTESTIASVFNKILILSCYPDARPLPADPHLANAKDIEQAASHARGALRIGKAVQEQKAILESLAHHSDQNSPEYVYRLSQLQTRGNEETESIWSLKIAIHYAKTHCWERFLQLKLLRNEAWIKNKVSRRLIGASSMTK